MKVHTILAIIAALISLSIQDGNQEKIEKAKQIVQNFKKHSPSTKSVDQLLFECDFDSGDCDLEYDEPLVGPTFELEDRLTTDSSYTFTDVTSITQATENGQVCQIPFSLNDQEYFHCTIDNECQTNNGLSNCKPGKFLGGTFSKAEDLNIIYIPVFTEPFYLNAYELSFQAFMHCEGEQCEELNDVIQVSAIYFDNDDYLEITTSYKYGDFNGKAWKQFSFNMTEIPRLLYVSVWFIKDFYAPRETKAYYGVDDMKVRYNGDDPTRVYKCNFDLDDCGFSTSLAQPKELLKIDSKLQTKTSYQFTDLTSITTPTANGQACSLPFSLNGNLYYHCTESNECLTSNGLSQCSRGRFLTGKSESAGQSFGVGVFPLIKIASNQRYQFSFESFMFCDSREACETELFVLFGNLASQNLIRLSLADFSGKTWKKFTSQFTSTDDSMFIEIRVKKSSSDTEIYYGIDELEIREVAEPTTTPAITTTTPGLNLKIFLPAILVPSLVLLVFLIIGLVVYLKRPTLCSMKKMRSSSIPMKSRNLVSPS